MIALKKVLILLCILFFAIGMSYVCLSSLWTHMYSNDDNASKEILINSNTKVNEDVIEFVDIFDNKGIIVGDLFMIGKEIWNDGTVIGDILGANQITYIRGISKGNVRVVTQRLEITGEVYRNVSAIVKDLVVYEAGVIDGSITVIGDRVEIGGLVSSDIRGRINTLIISGEIKGDVNIDVAKIQFGQNGKIQGDLNYKSNNEILMPSSKVNGEITYKKRKPIVEQHSIQRKTTILQGLRYLVKFFTMLFRCI